MSRRGYDDGTGWREGPCNRCGGTGRSARYYAMRWRCKACRGTGRLEYQGDGPMFRRWRVPAGAKPL